MDVPVAELVQQLLSSASLARARQILDEYWSALSMDVVSALESLAELARQAADPDAAGVCSFWAGTVERCLLVGTEEAFSERQQRTTGPVAVAWEQAHAASAAVGSAHDLDAAEDAWRRVVIAAELVEAPCPPLVHSIALAALGDASMTRYRVDFDAANLDTAVALWTRAGNDHRDLTWTAGVLNNLGAGLGLRYELRGIDQDLEDEVVAFCRARGLAAAGSAALVTALSGLGCARIARFHATHVRADLDLALEALEEAWRLCPSDSPDRPWRLTNLGLGLLARHAEDGAQRDLHRAVHVLRGADAGLPADAPEWSAVRANLGQGLLALYEDCGYLEIVQEAFGKLRDGLERTDPSDPAWPGMMQTLGRCEHALYVSTGELDSLVAAVRAYDQAVEGTGETAPELAIHLDSVAGARRDLFLRTGDQADLTAAVRAGELALASTPPEATERPRRLSTLANALAALYATGDDAAVLERSLDMAREALARAPATSPERWLYTANLAAGRLDRWERARDGADRDAAIGGYEAAVREAPPGAPETAALHYDLGAALQLRYETSQRVADADAAAASFARARQLGWDCHPEVSLLSAAGLGTLESRRGRWAEASAAYGQGLEAMHRLVRAQTARPHRESWLRVAQAVPTRAAYASIRAGQPPARAALLVESGRALLLSDALQSSRVELSALDALHPQLTERYRRAARRLAMLEDRAALPTRAPSAWGEPARPSRPAMDALRQP